MPDFAKIEVEAWKNLHMEDTNTKDLILAAHAAYDMSKYPQVREAFTAFIHTLSAQIAPGKLLLPKTRRKTVEYGIGSLEEQEVLDYIDLGGFARGFLNSKEAPDALKKMQKS